MADTKTTNTSSAQTPADSYAITAVRLKDGCDVNIGGRFSRVFATNDGNLRDSVFSKGGVDLVTKEGIVHTFSNDTIACTIRQPVEKK